MRGAVSAVGLAVLQSLLVRHLALAIMANGSAADVGRGAVLRQSGLAANVAADRMSITSSTSMSITTTSVCGRITRAWLWQL